MVGSTNFDARSFGLNDELNVAVADTGVTQRLEQDFQNDLRSSRAVGYAAWKARPVWEKAGEWLGWLIENQQ